MGNTRRRPALAALGLGLGLWIGAPTSASADANTAVQTATSAILSVSDGLGSIRQAVQKSKSEERSAPQRIADAQLLLGAKDYARAANVLNEVVDKYRDDPTVLPDALNLLGEVYFRSHQYLSARRVFRQIVARGSDGSFGAYQTKALGRLVDVALRTKDYSSLDEVFASMSRVPPSSVNSGLAYARGKALYAKRDYAAAKSSLASVDARSEHAHQARYLLGLMAAKEATPAPDATSGEAPPKKRYAAAIDLFNRTTQLPPDTADHKRVIDLAWLAIGRLFYESDQWTQAVQAYNRIDRTSPEFGVMLYELAWVYVRLGDIDRAQRALEVLAIADPESQNIADGTLLRADLMLRAGQFDKALKVYEGVRVHYDPLREKVEAFLGSTSDPAVYYDKLSQEQIEAFESNTIMPPTAVQWAREAEDGPAAFAVIESVVQCRELIKDSNELVERLNAVLSSPNRVRAFPDLKAGMERALSLINKVGQARLALGQGMDDVEDDALTGEIGSWRAKRRSLEKRMALLPVTDADFAARDNQAVRQWNAVSQGVQRLTLQIDSLHATVNGLRRMLREAPQAGVVRDPTSIARFEAELAQNEHNLALYRRQVDALRKMITAGKLQVGFGDQRFVEDAEVRRAYRDALSRETALAAQGAGGGALTAYAQRISPLLRSADDADARIEAAIAELDVQVEAKAREMRETVSKEVSNLVGYQVRLDELDGQARLVVGEVAMRNFGLVRDRLKNIVLRADVGVTEQAWELREEQMTRVRSLQVERAREDRVLKEELNEVLDDSGDEEEK